MNSFAAIEAANRTYRRGSARTAQAIVLLSLHNLSSFYNCGKK